MNYETEIIDGHKAVVRHFFKHHEIQVGSRWAREQEETLYLQYLIEKQGVPVPQVSQFFPNRLMQAV
jgi:hypothetical protein